VAQFLAANLALEPSRAVLRPPGALAEPQFLHTCRRCGNCLDACPPRAILLLHSGEDEADGTPYIDPDVQPCTICHELACVESCPSGALQPVKAAQIRMGLAKIDFAACLRSAGTDCRLCLETCPLGRAAIQLDPAAGRIRVRDPGCVGCGVCQSCCPARPTAIRVVPIRSGTRGR
jgi:MauM/NapG family ferredoxin protein